LAIWPILPIFLTMFGVRSMAFERPGTGGVMTALLAAVWLLVDYPWGLLAFVALATFHGLR
jgi:hypothetical protein